MLHNWDENEMSKLEMDQDCNLMNLGLINQDEKSRKKKVFTKQIRMNRTQGKIDPVEQKAVALLQWPLKVHKSLANFAALQTANKETFQWHIQVLPGPSSICHCCSHMFPR